MEPGVDLRIKTVWILRLVKQIWQNREKLECNNNLNGNDGDDNDAPCMAVQVHFGSKSN